MEPKQPPKSSIVTSSDNPSDADNPKRSALREFLSTVGVLATALIIALALIGFVFQSYEVSGNSMQITLQNQDRLIIWKLPRTWARITGHPYIPGRGDVIVFNEDNIPTADQNVKQLIKRVVGLPGDHVVIKDGAVTIYNKEHPDGFNPDKTLPYGHETTIPYTSGTIDLTLGENELFVCGDNRGNSYDSRTFGPIQDSQIVGKLVARIYPFSDAEKF
jgi:signal peptidase I